ncbi:MAG: porin family protein [Bacteroidota bacterium]
MYRLTIILVVLSLNQLWAQDGGSFLETISVSAKAGFNINTHSGDVGENVSPKFDFHVGGFAQSQISEQWGVTGELLYSREGYRVPDDDFVISLGFLNVSALANYSINEDLTLDFGALLAVKLNESTKLEDNKRNTNRYKPLRPGILAGSSYNINEKFTAQGRLIFKPTDLIRDDAGDNEGTTSWLLQFSVAYTIF